jgi:hypothetical protein
MPHAISVGKDRLERSSETGLYAQAFFPDSAKHSQYSWTDSSINNHIDGFALADDLRKANFVGYQDLKEFWRNMPTARASWNGITASLLIFMTFSLVLAPTLAEDACVCGTRRVLLVLAEFPEYKHLSSPQQISNLFFGQVARYVHDVSYGNLVLEGSVTEWTTLPRLYEQYYEVEKENAVLAVARDAFSLVATGFNFGTFDDIFLVLSFYPKPTVDYIGQSVATSSGRVTGFAVLEEDRSWSTYARGLALLIGLWRYQTQLSGLGSLDLAATGQGDLSAWSKLKLGWISESQILKMAAPTAREILAVSASGETGNGALALRILLPAAAGEYLVNVRQSTGYDKQSLREYGATVLHIPQENLALSVTKVLWPDDIVRAVFIDADADLALVALNQTDASIWLLIGRAQDGRDAMRGLFATTQASDAIRNATVQHRIQGLDLATQLLTKAHYLLMTGQFSEAEALALSAETTAKSATVPSGYQEAAQLIKHAEELKNKTDSISYSQNSQSWSLVLIANSYLTSARQAFDANNFSLAKQNAQAAIDTYDRADQIHQNEMMLNWISDLALLIPLVIFAYVLRYQLKRS